MLGTEGFNVYTTDLGEEGLDLGKLYDYDIILLDLNLPDMHGYEVLRSCDREGLDTSPDPLGNRQKSRTQGSRLLASGLTIT